MSEMSHKHIEGGQLRRWSSFEDAEMGEIFLVLGKSGWSTSTWCILHGNDVKIFDAAVLNLWSELLEMGEDHPVQR